MSMRPSRRIRIKRGVGPQGIPSVSVDAATAARQYGPLAHDTTGPLQQIGDFYDIRAFQDNEDRPLYRSATPWFEGWGEPTKQPLPVSPSQPPQEMLDQPPVSSVSYHGGGVDFVALMRAFMAMAESMGPSPYEPAPDAPSPTMPGPAEGSATSLAVEAAVDEVAGKEPACYQMLAPTPEAFSEPMHVVDQATMMAVSEIAPTPTAEDGLVALVQSMAEPLSALAEQQQEQVSQSLEAMVRDQMSLFGPAVAEDPSAMEQPTMDMMLWDMGLGPGM